MREKRDLEKKRILFIHQGTSRAGAFISLLGLLKGLDRSRFEIWVCSAAEDPEVVDLVRGEGYGAVSQRFLTFAHTSAAGWYHPWRIDEMAELAQWLWDYPRACRRLRELIKDLKPDLIHFNSLTLAPFACVARQMGVPVVVHVRESVAQGFAGVRKSWLSRELVEYANGIISICRDNLDALGLPDGKGMVIYNPVDFSRFDCSMSKTEARSALGVPADAKAVMFAGGSILPEKGLYEFIEAMAGLVSSEQQLCCLMPGFEAKRDLSPAWTPRRRIAKLMGRYRKRDRCSRFLTNSGLVDRIISCEFTSNMEQWLAACDVVCVCHIRPHFSRTVIEAGAMRKPVIAYALGGVEEVVLDSETGLALPVGDVEALKTAVQRVLHDQELCERLGDGGYRQARRLCDSSHYAQEVERIYDDVCAL